MIISDLNHCQDVKETPNLVGGSGYFSVFESKDQYSYLSQYGSASSDAESQFGGAVSAATVVNKAAVAQII